jgi:hypothetical protein
LIKSVTDTSTTRADSRIVINSFWDGERLSTLERVCISSFLHHGYAYELYVYDEPQGVPHGVVLRDAESILPRSQIFRYAAGDFNLGSIAGFADVFRYTLIYKRGGWWADTDQCCVNKFEISEPEAFFQEQAQRGEFRVIAGFFKAPAGSDVLGYCIDVIGTKDLAKVIHGEIGPELITAAIRACGKEQLVRRAEAFFPVPWWQYERLLYDEELSVDECSTVHFWNAMITSAKIDKDGDFPVGGVFGKMKRRYLNDAPPPKPTND